MNLISILFGIIVAFCQILFIYIFPKNLISNNFKLYWIFQDRMSKRDKYLLSTSLTLTLLFLILGCLFTNVMNK